MAGVGFGNYAFLTADGSLRFGGGGGGSENSHWTVGSASMRGIGWGVQLCSPPIIVDSVIYVPLISALAQAAPFTNAWLFEDRIDIFSTSWFPYGPWFGTRCWESGYERTPEEVAAMCIMVNGIKIKAYPAILSDEHGWPNLWFH